MSIWRPPGARYRGFRRRVPDGRHGAGAGRRVSGTCQAPEFRPQVPGARNVPGNRFRAREISGPGAGMLAPVPEFPAPVPIQIFRTPHPPLYADRIASKGPGNLDDLGAAMGRPSPPRIYVELVFFFAIGPGDRAIPLSRIMIAPFSHY